MSFVLAILHISRLTAAGPATPLQASAAYCYSTAVLDTDAATWGGHQVKKEEGKVKEEDGEEKLVEKGKKPARAEDTCASPAPLPSFLASGFRFAQCERTQPLPDTCPLCL